MKNIELKIKYKHLSEEPKIIKLEEHRLADKISKASKIEDWESKYNFTNQMTSLSNHRRFKVKPEARATHLARAFLAGATYEDVEFRRKDNIDKERRFRDVIAPRVASIVKKYNSVYTKETVYQWLDM